MQGVIKFVKGWLIFSLLWGILCGLFLAGTGQNAGHDDCHEPVCRFDLSGINDHGGALQSAARTGLIIHNCRHSFASR